MKPLKPNLLNVIKLLDDKVEVLVSDITSIDCPHCNQKLTIRPKPSPRYFFCNNCRRAFDPTLLYDTVSGTNDLETSILRIVQNNGIRDKVNAMNVGQMADYNCKAQISNNKLIDYTDEILDDGRWVEMFSGTLSDLGVYTGTKKSDVEVLRNTLSFWDMPDVGSFVAIDLLLQRSLRKKQGIGRRAIAVPSWSEAGVSGMWMFGTGKFNWYPVKHLDVTGGLAFVNETAEYPTVLATADATVALKLHVLHFSKFKRHAPLILFNKRTTREDWDTLGGKEVRFLDTMQGFTSKVVLEAALNYENSIMSPVSSENLGEDTQSYGLMHRALTTGLEVFKWVKTKVKHPTHKEFLKEVGLTRFVELSVAKYGQKKVDALNLGITIYSTKQVSYAGKIVEETNEGYKLKADTGDEIITNFTVTLDYLNRLRDKDDLVYQGVMAIDGKEIPVEFEASSLIGTSPRVEQLFQKVAVDNGVEVVPFVSSSWARKLADVIRLLNPDTQARIVCEQIMWDEGLDVFLLPGRTVRPSGFPNPVSFVSEEAAAGPLTPTDRRVNEFDMITFKKKSSPVISELIAYTVYAILAQKDLSMPRYPLVFIGSEGKNQTIEALLPGHMAIMPKIKQHFKSKLLEHVDQLAIIDANEKGAFELGAHGAAVLTEEIPPLLVGDYTAGLGKKFFTNLVRPLLNKALADEVNTMEGIRKILKEKYKTLKTKPGTILKHPVYTREECADKFIELGGTLNEFVATRLESKPKLKKVSNV